MMRWAANPGLGMRPAQAATSKMECGAAGLQSPPKPARDRPDRPTPPQYSQKFHCHLRIISSRAKIHDLSLFRWPISGMYLLSAPFITSTHQIQINRIKTFETIAK